MNQPAPDLGLTDLVDIRTAARLAGRSPETIRRWVWSGRILAHRQGNRLLVSRPDIVRLAAARAGQTALSLSEWVTRRERRAQGRSSRSAGSSAADLVLSDRRIRSGGDQPHDRR